MTQEMESAAGTQLVELEEIVERLVEVYEQLGVIARLRHEAVRMADVERITRLGEQEKLIAQEATQLEPVRARLVRDIAQRLGGPAGQAITITWIAQRIAGERGAHLESRARALRERLETVKKENDIVRRSLVHLAAHMEGLWRQAASMLNHARTYGRSGGMDPGPSVVSNLDLTT